MESMMAGDFLVAGSGVLPLFRRINAGVKLFTTVLRLSG
jgi:hypothetical protein